MGVKPSPDRKMIKLLTVDNFFCHNDAVIASRMTTAITFSRQNDPVSRACTT